MQRRARPPYARRRIIALLVLALAGYAVSLAAAQTDGTPRAFAAQTSTTPEDVGQDFGDDGQTGDTSGNGTPQALPVTGWRGRDAVMLGLVLLGSGFWLRVATARPRS